jgi:hypothetical protein
LLINRKAATTGRVHDGNMLRYRASKFDCEVCALKMQCCPKGPSRQIPRDLNEYARDVARRLMRTKTFLKSRDERKRVEMRFAHLKVHHRFERMRLRAVFPAPATSSISPQLYKPRDTSPANPQAAERSTVRIVCPNVVAIRWGQKQRAHRPHANTVARSTRSNRNPTFSKASVESECDAVVVG